jgi:hypothetical protein
MLLAIPFQTIELSNIALQPYYKDKKERTIAPIYYNTNGFTMHGFTILTPPLPVTSYDPSMNRLQLNLTNHRSFANKFIAVQDSLAHMNPSMVFQRLCSPNTLTLYLFPSTPIKNGPTNKTIMDVKPGDTLRCVIRLHTLLLIEMKGQETVRLQHSVPIIYQTSG